VTPVRSLLAFSGWFAPAEVDGWWGADATGRPLILAHGGVRVGVASNAQGTVRTVLAGALYNARQLRSSLEARRGVCGRDEADVVTQLYEERGVQCLQALRGAFAVALWDARLQRLFLARDQLGLVPLYYAVDGRRLAAASTLPTLLAIPGLAGPWDAAGLDAFLTLGLVPPPATFYSGIRQLRPGELVLWEDGRVRTQRYWQLTFPGRRMTRADVPALLREQLLEVLRLRQAGVVSGLLLSGGLDAAALLALAAADRRLPARAYTAAFAEDDEELDLAAGLAARAGVEHVAVTGEPDWPAALDRLLAAHGGPVGPPELALVQMAARRASSDVAIVLAGVGGEQVLGGSAPARAAERIRRYRELPGLAREGAHLWSRLAPAGWGRALRQLIEEERFAPLELYARAVSLVLPEERARLYTPDALAALGDSRPWAELANLFAEAVSGGAAETLDAIHYVELTLGLPARSAGAGAAADGLELRHPLADHRLAQFVASVPPAARGSAAERQLLLRAALGELLPAAVARRGHVRAQPRSWRLLLEDTLPAARIRAQGVFRPEAVARLCEEHLRGQGDHEALLWAIVMTTRWLDGQSRGADTGDSPWLVFNGGTPTPLPQAGGSE